MVVEEPNTRIDILLLDRYYDEFIAAIRDDSHGEEFLSFSHSFMVKHEEYKNDLRIRARKRLDCGNWAEADIGSERIIRCTIAAVEDAENNMLVLDNRRGADRRAHVSLAFQDEQFFRLRPITYQVDFI